MDYCFDMKDKDFTTMLVKKYNMPCDACEKMVELYRLKMGSARYDAMKIHTIEDIFNYFT